MESRLGLTTACGIYFRAREQDEDEPQIARGIYHAADRKGTVALKRAVR